MAAIDEMMCAMFVSEGQPQLRKHITGPRASLGLTLADLCLSTVVLGLIRLQLAQTAGQIHSLEGDLYDLRALSFGEVHTGTKPQLLPLHLWTFTPTLKQIDWDESLLRSVRD